MKLQAFLRGVAILLGVCSVLAAVAGFLLWRSAIPPWKGSQPLFREPVPYVVVGPVDTTDGIRGMVEIGMPITEVTRRLGKPLVWEVRRTAETDILPSYDALDYGVVDPTWRFYSGANVWVSPGIQQCAASIEFHLDGYSERYFGEQGVLLEHKGKHLIVNRRTTRASLLAGVAGRPVLPFQARYPITPKNPNPPLYITGSLTELSFDPRSGRLRLVTLGWDKLIVD